MKWIGGCLLSMSFAVVVNEKPHEWFQVSRELRQGDPLSPFLFTMVVDVLSRMLTGDMERNKVRGLVAGKDRIEVSHL